MIYEYHCTGCERVFDVVKSVKDMEVNETCSKCGEFAERRFVPSRVFFNGTKVEHPEYNPGLGCIVRNSSHRKEIARSKGLIEIGNEPVESVHKLYDKQREEKHEKVWSQVDQGWVGNGE